MASALDRIRKRTLQPFYQAAQPEPPPPPVVEPQQATMPTTAEVPTFEQIDAPEIPGMPELPGLPKQPDVVGVAPVKPPEPPPEPKVQSSRGFDIFNQVDVAKVAELIPTLTIRELRAAGQAEKLRTDSDDYDVNEIYGYMLQGTQDTDAQRNYAKSIKTTDQIVRGVLVDEVKKRFEDDDDYQAFLGALKDSHNAHYGEDKQIKDLQDAETLMAGQLSLQLQQDRNLNLSTLASEALKKGADIAGKGGIVDTADMLVESDSFFAGAPVIPGAKFAYAAARAIPGVSTVLDTVQAPVRAAAEAVLPEGIVRGALGAPALTQEERDKLISEAAKETVDEAKLRAGASTENLELEPTPAKSAGQLFMPSGDFLRDFAQNVEGVRLTIYDDATGRPISSYEEARGTPHIGVGHAILSKEDRERFKAHLSGGTPMTQDAAVQLYNDDIAKHARPLQGITAPVTQQMLDAVFSAAYRWGPDHSSIRDIVQTINTGDYRDAAARIRNLAPTSKGTDTTGQRSAIARRHGLEADLFLSGGIPGDEGAATITPAKQIRKEQAEESAEAEERKLGYKEEAQLDFESTIFNHEDFSEVRAKVEKETGLEISEIGGTFGDMFSPDNRGLARAGERGHEAAIQTVQALAGTELQSVLEEAQHLPMGRSARAAIRQRLEQKKRLFSVADLTPERLQELEAETVKEVIGTIADMQTVGEWVAPVFISYNDLLATTPPEERGLTWGMGDESPGYFVGPSVLNPTLEVVGRDNNGELILRQTSPGVNFLDTLDAIPVVGQSYLIGSIENFFMRPLEALAETGGNPLAAYHQAGLRGVAERRNFVEVGMQMTGGATDFVTAQDWWRESAADVVGPGTVLGDVLFEPEETATQRVQELQDDVRVAAQFLGGGVGLAACVFYPVDLLFGLGSAARGARSAVRTYRGQAAAGAVAESLRAQHANIASAGTGRSTGAQELRAAQKGVEDILNDPTNPVTLEQVKGILTKHALGMKGLQDAEAAEAAVRQAAPAGMRDIDRLDRDILDAGNLDFLGLGAMVNGQKAAKDVELAGRIDGYIDAARAEGDRLAALPSRTPDQEEVLQLTKSIVEFHDKLGGGRYVTLHAAALRDAVKRAPGAGKVYNTHDRIQLLHKLTEYVDRSKSAGDLGQVLLDGQLMRVAAKATDKGTMDFLGAAEARLLKPGKLPKDAPAGLSQQMEQFLGDLKQAIGKQRDLTPDVIDSLRVQVEELDLSAFAKSSETERAKLIGLIDDLKVAKANVDRSLDPAKEIMSALGGVYFSNASRSSALMQVADRIKPGSVAPPLKEAAKAFFRQFPRDFVSVISWGNKRTPGSVIDATRSVLRTDGTESVFNKMTEVLNSRYTARVAKERGIPEAEFIRLDEAKPVAQRDLYQPGQLRREAEANYAKGGPALQFKPGFSLPKGWGVDGIRAGAGEITELSAATRAFVLEQPEYMNAFGRMFDPTIGPDGEWRRLKQVEKESVAALVEGMARYAAGVERGDGALVVEKKLKKYYDSITIVSAKGEKLSDEDISKLAGSLKARLLTDQKQIMSTTPGMAPQAAWDKAVDDFFQGLSLDDLEEYLPILGLDSVQADLLRRAIETDRVPAEAPVLFQRAADETSDAFKQWFGDSKVVDAGGKPLVVYHGTTRDFQAFEAGYRGDDHPWSPLGFWFSDNPKIASSYAGMPSGPFGEQKVGGSVIPVFVSVKNPLRINYDDLLDMDRAGAVALRNRAAQGGHDGLQIGRYGGAEGYDFVAFEPEQIKSVFNRGTFDPDDPRILFQRGIDQVEVPEIGFGDLTLSETNAAMRETRTGVELADFIIKNADNEDYRVIAERIRPHLAETQVHVVERLEDFPARVQPPNILPSSEVNSLARLIAHPTRTLNRGLAIALKPTDEGRLPTEVYLRGMAEKTGVTAEVALHELIHAATMRRIHDGRYLANKGTKLTKSVDELSALRDQVVGIANKAISDGDIAQDSDMYRMLLNATQDQDEFVAYGLSNRAFQDYLTTIKIDKQSAWSVFVQRVAGLLGISSKEQTALSELLRITEEVLEAPVSDLTTRRLTAPLLAQMEAAPVTDPRVLRLIEFVKAEPRTKKAIGEKFGLRGNKLTEFINKAADTGAISVPARGKKATFLDEAPDEAAPAAAKAPTPTAAPAPASAAAAVTKAKSSKKLTPDYLTALSEDPTKVLTASEISSIPLEELAKTPGVRVEGATIIVEDVALTGKHQTAIQQALEETNSSRLPALTARQQLISSLTERTKLSLGVLANLKAPPTGEGLVKLRRAIQQGEPIPKGVLPKHVPPEGGTLTAAQLQWNRQTSELERLRDKLDAASNPKVEIDDLAKGAAIFIADGSQILLGLRSADVTTGLHEMSHVLRRYLHASDRSVVAEFMNTNLRRQDLKGRVKFDADGRLLPTTQDQKGIDALIAAEEAFAEAFEKYIHSGLVPDNTPMLKRAFTKLKDLFGKVYDIVGAGRGVEDTLISPEMYDFFDKIYGANKQVSFGELSDMNVDLDAYLKSRGMMDAPPDEVEAFRGGRLAASQRLAGRIKEERIEETTALGRLRQFALSREQALPSAITTLGQEARAGITSAEAPAQLLSERQALAQEGGTLAAAKGLLVEPARGATRALLNFTVGGDPEDALRRLPTPVRPLFRSVINNAAEFTAVFSKLATDWHTSSTNKKSAALNRIVDMVDGTSQPDAKGRIVRTDGVRRVDEFLDKFDETVGFVDENGQASLVLDAERVLGEFQSSPRPRQVNVPEESALNLIYGGVSTTTPPREVTAAALLARPAVRDARLSQTIEQDALNKDVLGLLRAAFGNEMQHNVHGHTSALLMFLSGNAKIEVNGQVFTAADLGSKGRADVLVNGYTMSRKVGDATVEARLPGLRELTSDEHVVKALYAISSGGEAGRAFRNVRMARLGLAPDDYKIYLKGQRFRTMSPSEHERFIALRKKFGVDANFTQVVDRMGVYYVPSEARARIIDVIERAEKALLAKEESDKVRQGVMGILQYTKMATVFGGLGIRRIHHINSTLDIMRQLTGNVSLQVGATAAARVSGMTIATLIHLPFIPASDLFRATSAADFLLDKLPESQTAPLRKLLADKSGAAVDHARARAAIVRIARDQGDKWATAVDKFFGGAKYNISTNHVIDGIEGGAFIGDRYYSFKDIRQVFLEEGIFSTSYKEMSELMRRMPGAGNPLLRMRDQPGVANVEEIAHGLTELGRGAMRHTKEQFMHGAEIADVWGETERVGGALTLMEQGITPRDAARIVTESLYDYRGSMTQADHGIVRQLLMPFFSFRKNAVGQLINMMGGARGAYVAGVLIRAERYGAELISDLLYESVVSPYGVNTTALTPDQSEFYYELRNVIENGLGDVATKQELAQFRESLPKDQRNISDEELLDYSFDGWTIRDGYNGYSNVPEDVRISIRAMLAGNFEAGTRAGEDLYTVKGSLARQQLVNKFVQEGLRGAVVPESGLFELPSYMDIRPVIDIPLPFMQETAKAAVREGRASYAHLVVSENSLTAAMDIVAATIATGVLATRAGVQAVTPGVDVDVTGEQLTSAIESIVNRERMSPGGEFLKDLLAYSGEQDNRPVILHPIIARHIELAQGLPLTEYPEDTLQLDKEISKLQTAGTLAAGGISGVIDAALMAEGYEVDLRKVTPLPVRVTLDEEGRRKVKGIPQPGDILPAEGADVAYKPYLLGGRVSTLYFNSKYSSLGELNRILLAHKPTDYESVAASDEALRNDIARWAVWAGRKTGVIREPKDVPTMERPYIK